MPDARDLQRGDSDEEEPIAPRIRMDTSSRLGQLLLSGWQMMADSCPTCQVGCLVNGSLPQCREEC